MHVLNLKTKTSASNYVAIELLKLLKINTRPVIGLATGDTMIEVYQRLRLLLNINKLDLNQVVTFNLDEYIGLEPSHKQSYYHYMYSLLFDYNSTWNETNIHIPNGVGENLDQSSLDYEQQLIDLGPADVQILGIGQNGHIGFNEPGTPFDSTTRIVDLTESTIKANSIHFDAQEVIPKKAISMGLDSIIRAKRIILLAFGNDKIEAIQRLLTEPVSESLPASILQRHPNVEIIIDDTIFNNLKY